MELVLTLVTVLVLAFFWLVGRPELQGYALGFAPASHRIALRGSWDEMEGRLGIWVRAQLTVMVIIGVATSVAYSVVGLPSALLLGVFAGFAEAIPIVGPLIGAIPAIVIALTISPQTALIVGVIYLVIQFAESNILVPGMMKDSIGISPFVLIVLLLIGGALGGILGAFVAVPIAAALQVLLERVHAAGVDDGDPGAAAGSAEGAMVASKPITD